MENWDWPTILLYLSIPVTSAVVGWGTNLIAIKMTFYPLEYIGVRPFGWQGIIPSKSTKMADKAVDLLTSKLMRIEEQFVMIDPKRVAEEMDESLQVVARKIIDEVMLSQAQTVWERTPEALKNKVYSYVASDMPQIVEAIMADIKADINELVDVKRITISAILADKDLINQIFLRCGKDEFIFIERSGAYFGFLFGLVQMACWYYFPLWWTLPLFGLIVGYATNWLALKLIFEPRKPINFGFYTLQGLFLKRQQEVSVEYSNIITTHIVTTESLFDAIIRGPGAEKLAEIISIHVGKAVDGAAGVAMPVVNMMGGEKRLEIIKNIAVYRFMQELPVSIRDVFAYAEEALKLQDTIREKMAALSSDEFEAFLRPAFQEDEFTLILVGAILGMLAGFAQYYFMF